MHLAGLVVSSRTTFAKTNCSCVTLMCTAPCSTPYRMRLSHVKGELPERSTSLPHVLELCSLWLFTLQFLCVSASCRLQHAAPLLHVTTLHISTTISPSLAFNNTAQTGGLRNTVIDFDPWNKAGTGWTYTNCDAEGLGYSVGVALQVGSSR